MAGRQRSGDLSGSEPGPAEVLVGSPRRQVRLLVIGGVLTAGGIGALTSGQTAVGVFGVAFFGLCTLVALLAMIRPFRLELSPDGFRTVAFGWRRSDLYEWHRCSDFRLYTPPSSIYSFRRPSARSRLVGYDYRSDRRRRAKRLSRALGGVECALPDTYGMTAPALRDLLLSRQWEAVHRHL